MSEPTFTADQLRQCAEDYREKIPGERTDDELVAMLEFAARLVERIPEGWRCPKCQTIYAPSFFTCVLCNPKVLATSVVPEEPRP